MKYRQLTKEQLESLHKEFAQFLATQKIDAVQWQKMKSENSSLVEEELNLFSDMVWDDVLSKVEYLEHFSDNSVNFFKCEKEAEFSIDFEFSKPSFTIEEILIVGIMFFVIYLRGFSVAID